MKKQSFLQAIIFFGFAVLIGVGNALYRHFGKGVPIFVAFHQELVEDGILFLSIAIVSILIIAAQRIWMRSSRRK